MFYDLILTPRNEVFLELEMHYHNHINFYISETKFDIVGDPYMVRVFRRNIKGEK